MYWMVLILSTVFGIWLGLTGRIPRLWKVIPVLAFLVIAGATSLWKNNIVSAVAFGLVIGPLLSLLPFFRALAGRPVPRQPARRGDRRNQRQPCQRRQPSGGQRFVRDANRAAGRFNDDLRGIGQRYRDNRRPRNNGGEE